MNDIKRPKQKVKRQIKRSNIALDEYMFDRKMQSLYYGAKPVSDDTPTAIKLLRRVVAWVKRECKALPQTLKFLPARLKKSARKHPAQYLLGILIAGVVIVFGAALISKQRSKTPAAPPVPIGEKTKSPIPVNQTPDFAAVLPQGKTAQDVGGFAKVSPVGSPAAYAYRDTLAGVDILVTQQALPDSMKAEPGKKVEELALSFQATQAVKTEKAEFFIGTNANGQQSIVSYTKSLLILIKSSGKIANDRWQTYVEDLK